MIEALCIRPARPEEAAALTELGLRSKALWGYSPDFLARCRAAMRLAPEAVVARAAHVAEADGRLLGFYAFGPEEEGIGLDFLFVAPEEVRRGVGRLLWRHAVETARDLGHRMLVVVSDPHAEGFYRRMGASPAGGRASDIEGGRVLPVLRFALD